MAEPSENRLFMLTKQHSHSHWLSHALQWRARDALAAKKLWFGEPFRRYFTFMKSQTCTCLHKHTNTVHNTT